MSAAWSSAIIERVRGMVASGLSAREIAEQTDISRKGVIGLVWRNKLGPWLASTGVKPAPIVVPADFADNYAKHTFEELRGIYRRSNTTLRVWASHLGLESRQGRPIRSSAVTAAPCSQRKRRQVARPQAFVIHPIDRAHRDVSEAGQAADYLRRYGPVIRCGVDGHYRADGDHWRRGSTVLAAAEIVERAKFNGWKPWDAAA